MSEKFSVLMSVYRDEKAQFLRESLDSIERQTCIPDQIVLVKDGPLTIELENEIEKFSNATDIKLDVISLNKNYGLAFALNAGLKKCRNNLVARMDTDDIALKTRFEKLLKTFKNNPEIDICGSYIEEIDFYGNKLNFIREMPVNDEEIKKKIWTCPIIHPSVMYKRNKILELGGYDQSLRRRQDYELWYRASKEKLIFHNIPSVLLYYRIDSKSYRKKNNIKVQWNQLLIAYRGNNLNSLPLITYIAVTLNFLLNLMPGNLGSYVKNKVRRSNGIKKGGKNDK